MNKIEKITNDFIEHVETNLGMNVEIISQQELKTWMEEDGNEFPMISYEYTPDTKFEVSVDESKFLNDSIYEGDWLSVSNICLMKIEVENDTLTINTFEINENYRNEGFARKIIDVLEHVSKSYLNNIKIIPFDNNAKDFWEHLEYKNEDDKLYKRIG